MAVCTSAYADQSFKLSVDHGQNSIRRREEAGATALKLNAQCRHFLHLPRQRPFPYLHHRSTSLLTHPSCASNTVWYHCFAPMKVLTLPCSPFRYAHRLIHALVYDPAAMNSTIGLSLSARILWYIVSALMRCSSAPFFACESAVLTISFQYDERMAIAHIASCVRVTSAAGQLVK